MVFECDDKIIFWILRREEWCKFCDTLVFNVSRLNTFNSNFKLNCVIRSIVLWSEPIRHNKTFFAHKPKRFPGIFVAERNRFSVLITEIIPFSIANPSVSLIFGWDKVLEFNHIFCNRTGWIVCCHKHSNSSIKLRTAWRDAERDVLTQNLLIAKSNINSFSQTFVCVAINFNGRKRDRKICPVTIAKPRTTTHPNSKNKRTEEAE